MSGPANHRSVNFVTCKNIHSQPENVRMQPLIIFSQMAIEKLTCVCMYEHNSVEAVLQ